MSAGKGFQEIWGPLPAYAKGIIAVAVIAGVGFIGYKIYKAVAEYAAHGGERAEGSDAKKDLKSLIASGQKPSYSDSQYSQWANQLKEAFDGCGTSNGAWDSIFQKLHNDVDVLKLNQAYGIRTFDGCNWEGDFGDFSGTLAQALVHELSDSELKSVNSYLTKSGIKFQY